MKRRLAMLKILIAQERKKAVTLGALLVLLVVMGARAFLVLGPRTSRADATSPSDSVSTLASAGKYAVDRAMASDDALRPGKTVEVVRSPRVSRDLFAADPAYFPLPPQATQPEVSEGRPRDAEVESPPQNADDDAKRREAQLVEETAGWRLTSVLLGQHPTAVVEGDGSKGRASVLRAGQTLREWVVVEITASSVMFEKQGVRVRLSLAKHER